MPSRLSVARNPVAPASTRPRLKSDAVTALAEFASRAASPRLTGCVGVRSHLNAVGAPHYRGPVMQFGSGAASCD